MQILEREGATKDNYCINWKGGGILMCEGFPYLNIPINKKLILTFLTSALG